MTTNNNKVDLPYLAAATTWSLTAGTLVSQVLQSPLGAQTALLPGCLALNWMISPFDPRDGFWNSSMSTQEKACRVFSFSLLIVGLAAPLLNAYLLPQMTFSVFSKLQMKSLLVRVTLVALNLMACKSLRARSSLSAPSSFIGIRQAASATATGIIFVTSKFVDRGNENNRKEEERKRLILETQALREQNQELSQIFGYLKELLTHDLEVQKAYSLCVKKADLVNSPPIMGKSSSSKNPVIKNFITETSEHNYWSGWKTRFNLFMEKHTDFRVLLERKLKEKGITLNLDARRIQA